MKKLLLFALLFTSIVSFAQKTFVKKYTSMISTKNYKENEIKEINLTVVFNPDKKKGAKFYFEDGKVKTFTQIRKIEKGFTENGTRYQLMIAIDDENGYEVGIQLFDDVNALRILIDDGYNVEYYE